jgi:signal transduction histidine kinase
MGRLFWKFFFIFWVAQVVTSIGVGFAVWASRPQQIIESGHEIQMRPPAHPMPPASMLPHPFGPPPPESQQARGFLPPLIPMLAGSAISLIFAWLLAWYFSRPIRLLRNAFDAAANGKLETRIALSMGKRNDELSDLGQNFDHMAERLQNLMESHRRLLHDVSHEVRSPLARLQAATDLMQQQPERAIELIPRLQRDTARIDTLVGELLTLARLNSGMAKITNEMVDVCELIEQIAHDARLEADTKHCRVEVSLPESMIIRGNHELLYRAIENVVRNAVLHSPEESRVGIVVRPDNSTQYAVITVSDQGNGVPPSQLESIFQPFFRSASNSEKSGYGLGLAITQRVVQAHGGKIGAKNLTLGGLEMEISLPCVAAST